MATSSAMRLLGSAGTGFGQGWETRKKQRFQRGIVVLLGHYGLNWDIADAVGH